MLKLYPPPPDAIPQTRKMVSLEGLEEIPAVMAGYFNYPEAVFRELTKSYFESIAEELIEEGHAAVSFGSFDWNPTRFRVEFTYYKPLEQEEWEYLELLKQDDPEA